MPIFPCCFKANNDGKKSEELTPKIVPYIVSPSMIQCSEKNQSFQNGDEVLEFWKYKKRIMMEKNSNEALKGTNSQKNQG